MNPDSSELKALVQRITDLPTLPSMMATITRLMQDPRTSADELGRAISADPSLVSKVLKLVNSAFYGFPGRISTITQAIVILGFSTIRNVVLTTSVLKAFGKNGSPGADVGKFWEHSLLTGAIARALAKDRGAHFVEETFIAGLLHDMGRIVLSQKLPAEFEKVLQAKRQAGIPQLQAEQAVLKLTHGDIGGWLARKWNLPVPFVEVMRLHHFPLRILEGDPLPDETANLVFMIHAADAMAKGFKDGALQADSLAGIDPKVRAELKLDVARWDGFKTKAEEEIGKAKTFLEIL